MSAKIIFVFCCFLTGYASSAATYDQRQTGDLNVQVDLKDLRIIALMKGGKEEYVDYDYAYDYSEMTIKPQNGTTPKPLNGTSTIADSINDNTTSPVVITEQSLAIKNNNSLSLEPAEVTTPYSNNDSSTTVKSLEITTITAAGVPEGSTKDVPSTSTLRPTSPSTNGCKKGFVMNQKGDCELKLQGAGNALLKLVKLSQTLKLRRENRRNEGASE